MSIDLKKLLTMTKEIISVPKVPVKGVWQVETDYFGESDDYITCPNCSNVILGKFCYNCGARVYDPFDLDPDYDGEENK